LGIYCPSTGLSFRDDLPQKAGTAAIDQAGAIQVFSLEELVDTTLALMTGKPPRGRNLGLISISGGSAVNLADLSIRMGFSMPPFQVHIKKELSRLLNDPGTGIQNPVDMAAAFFNTDNLKNVFQLLDQDDGLDIIIIHVSVEHLIRFKKIIPNKDKLILQAISDALLTLHKPFALILPYTLLDDQRKTFQKQLLDKQIPVFPTIERALQAIKHSLKYHQTRIKKIGEANMYTKNKDNPDSNKPTLDYIFHPKSIAIAGASNNPASKGFDYLKALQVMNFKGPIYPINPKGGEVLGLKAYSSIKDIPGSAEYIISCVDAKAAMQLISDCSTKGTRTIHLFTAGFSETGEEKGKEIEDKLLQIARQAGIRIIGPNCLGLHHPNWGMGIGQAPFSIPGGHVGCLAQSGGHAWDLISRGSLNGIRFSKVISFGNACDLNEADYLDYFADDPDTEIISAYIEGVKHGDRFLDAIKKAASSKPLLILKGGCTAAGTRAASSHTGSLAGLNRIWEGLFRQMGVISLNNIDELIDALLPHVYFPPIKSGNIGIIGLGGGVSVEAADACEINGLTVPPLPEKLIAKLKGFTAIAGCGLKNPVDTIEIWDKKNFTQTTRLVASYNKIDLLIVHAIIEMTSQWQGNSILDNIIDSLLESSKTINKPIVIVLQTYGTLKGTTEFYRARKRLNKAGMPVFSTFSRAAAAISKFIQYHQKR